MKNTQARTCLSAIGDNPVQIARDYLFHQILFNSKHPGFLDRANVSFFNIMSFILTELVLISSDLIVMMIFGQIQVSHELYYLRRGSPGK